MRQLKITPSITGRDSASIDKYLSEISKEPLITAEEEAELARRARAGDALALEQLVRANLRFVVSVAKQYQHYGINLADLINEGNLGLIKAAKRFDETRGFKFISYAVWWIRQCIHNAIAEHSRVIRIPSNQNNYINRINKFSREFEQLNQREPTPDEVSEGTEIEAAKVKDLLNVCRKHVSLDEPLVDGEEGSLLDLICSKSSDSEVDYNLMQESLAFEIKRSLSFLSPKEQEIVSLYYGIDKPYSLSVDEISELLNISRERVRQIKEKAIRRLRSQYRCRNLQQFLG
ncbi:MAG: RNA polymerase sigma factor RpoD/SigA [Bacteroidia bacterium]|nr:RNA polymerase sigma factor RpoD/SigA [Bacteroidia bacterium]